MKRIAATVFALFFFNCAGPVQEPPVVARKTPTREASQQTKRVHWVEVQNGNEFWVAVTSKERNLALIGTEYCQPCKLVKAWWEEKFAPPGWQFVYWQLNYSDDILTRKMKNIFRSLQESDNLTVPYLSVIEGAGDPHRSKKITETFRAFEGCTAEANKFLLMHPQGTIEF